MKVQGIMIFWNRLEYAKICLETYLKSTSYPHILLLVDNCSTDGTKEWLQQLEKEYNEGKIKTGNIKLKFRYYIKNFGPLRVENHFIRDPIDKDAEYYLRIFTDLDFSKMSYNGDWLESWVDLLIKVPRIASIAPTDREWPDIIEENGRKFVPGYPFEFSEEFRLTRRSIYEQFGRPLYNIWSATPSWFFSSVRDSWNRDKTFQWTTVVDPLVKICHIYDELQLEKTNDFYKKHQLISRRIFSKAKDFIEATLGILEWCESDEKGNYKHCVDFTELACEAMCLAGHLNAEHIEAELDNGITQNDLKLLEKDGLRYTQWKGTKERYGW